MKSLTTGRLTSASSRACCDQLQPVAHVRLGQLPVSAKGLQGRTETFLQRFEHGNQWRIRETKDDAKPLSPPRWAVVTSSNAVLSPIPPSRNATASRPGPAGDK